MFCIIFFKTIPNILLLLFLSPEFNKICLNEERNCIAETNILNKSFKVSFNIYVWWYIYILKQYKTFWRIHCICQLYSLVLQVKIKESQSIVFTKWCRDIFGYFVWSGLVFFFFFLWPGIFLTISMIYLRELYKEMIVLILQVHHQMVVIRIKLRFLKQS